MLLKEMYPKDTSVSHKAREGSRKQVPSQKGWSEQKVAVWSPVLSESLSGNSRWGSRDDGDLEMNLGMFGKKGSPWTKQ